MSIIWLDNILKFHNYKLEMESQDILIYLNMLSCLAFVVYSFLYKSDSNLSNPPSNLFL